MYLIGGASGTGKSTLANRLLHEMGLDHRLGTGFVRAIVQAETTPARNPLLYSMTYEADDPVAHLQWQADRLRPAVMRCIERARAEGTSLVIEGSHLLPSLYLDGVIDGVVDGFVVLVAPDPEEHFRRLTGDTHTRRSVTALDAERIREIDAFYRVDAAAAGVSTVVYDDNVDDIRALLTAGR